MKKPGLFLSLLVILLSALPAYEPRILSIFSLLAANTNGRARPATPSLAEVVQSLPTVQTNSAAHAWATDRDTPEAAPSSAWLERRASEARALARVSSPRPRSASRPRRGRGDESPQPRPVSKAAAEPGPRLVPGAGDLAAASHSNIIDRAAAAPAAPLLPAALSYPAALRQIPLVLKMNSPAAAADLAGREIRAGGGASPYLALTIDCEQNPQRTRQMLEILRAEGVRATFFLSGYYAYLYPDVVAQIAAGGHELGNHSFTHPRFSTLDPVTATLEILYTEAAVDRAVGRHVPMRYVRFPYGERDETILLHAAGLGYRSAFWDMDPQGWSARGSAADVVSYVRQRVHPGGVVIMHCGSANDVEALPEVLRLIRERGLIPGTLSEAIAPWGRLLLTHPQRLLP